jgi:hypothetical protein
LLLMDMSREHLGNLRGLAPVALVPPAAFAVHQLRYMLAFGSNAGLELERQGHSYLHSVVPWIVLLLALAVGGFLLALGRALRGQCSLPRYTLSFAGLWLACTAALVSIYVCQELLEGVLLTGHPGGFEGVFGYGGWWAIPAAVCIALVLAAVFHGARWLLSEVAQRRAAGAPAPRVAVPVGLLRPRPSLAPVLAPLASGRSGRGPPS